MDESILYCDDDSSISRYSSGYLSKSDLSILSNEPQSGDLTRELKVDKRILEIMQKGGDEHNPSSEEFFNPLRKRGVEIDFSSSFRDRQGNIIPIVKVSANILENLEYACAKIMQSLDPHRDKMTFNIDVPSSDHSFIIGKDGIRIKQLSKDTRCHIHLPDCNKASGKKSNKISIAGTTFNSIEQARDSIRKNLPLNIQFCLEVGSNKISLLDSSSSEIQSIKRRHMVDVNFFGLQTFAAQNSQPGSITVAVKGNRAQIDSIHEAIREVFELAYGIDYYNEALNFEISIDISYIHHQYVRGKNNCNLKVIHQRCGASIVFPTDKSNVVRIQSPNIQRVVMGWQEIMGYLPLMLSFDLNMDEELIKNYALYLEKKHSISIRYREKLASTIYTLFIKTQERHSLCLNEIREQFASLKKNPETKQVSNTNSILQELNPSCLSPGFPISQQTINTFKFPVESLPEISSSSRISSRSFGNDLANLEWFPTPKKNQEMKTVSHENSFLQNLIPSCSSPIYPNRQQTIKNEYFSGESFPDIRFSCSSNLPFDNELSNLNRFSTLKKNPRIKSVSNGNPFFSDFLPSRISPVYPMNQQTTRNEHFPAESIPEIPFSRSSLFDNDRMKSVWDNNYSLFPEN